MKSIILCEGSTDFVLLQYFMRKVYGKIKRRMSRQEVNISDISALCLKMLTV